MSFGSANISIKLEAARCRRFMAAKTQKHKREEDHPPPDVFTLLLLWRFHFFFLSIFSFGRSRSRLISLFWMKNLFGIACNNDDDSNKKFSVRLPSHVRSAAGSCCCSVYIHQTPSMSLMLARSVPRSCCCFSSYCHFYIPFHFFYSNIFSASLVIVFAGCRWLLHTVN